MLKKYFIFTAAFLCFWFKASAALAAPFCIEAQGLPSECWYYDVQSCRQEAVKRNGQCSINFQEMVFSEHGAPFCIINSGMIPVCAYQSGENCNEEAARQNGICFQNAYISDQDPYHLDRPSFKSQ